MRLQDEALVGLVWKKHDREILEDHNPQTLMSDSELEAMKRAGRLAGGYLTDIGKTDMAALDVEEWRLFCSKLILGFEAELIGLLSHESA